MLMQNPDPGVLFKEVKAVKGFYAKVISEDGSGMFRLVEKDEVVTLSIGVANEVIHTHKAVLVEDLDSEVQEPVIPKPKRGRPRKEASDAS